MTSMQEHYNDTRSIGSITSATPAHSCFTTRQSESSTLSEGDAPKFTNVPAPSTTSSTGPQLRLIDQKVRRTSLVTAELLSC